VGFSFYASLEPRLRAHKSARLAEDALAYNAFWTGRDIPRIPGPILGTHVRLNAGCQAGVSSIRPCREGSVASNDPFGSTDGTVAYCIIV